jgi:uncharacterized protein YdeI (YjbR/CyaY-like superfamily)
MTPVEIYIHKKEAWKQELTLLRSVFTNLPLEETIKWGAPTYVFKGKNIVGLAAFKKYCGLWFFQGALLEDKQKKLINAQEGKTKAMLQWRFYTKDEIDLPLIKQYVLEAMHQVAIGNEVKFSSNTKPLVIPLELSQQLAIDKSLEANFRRFSKSKQHEFAAYIAMAKRAETKEKRLQKIIPMILSGEGLNDRYKKS